MRTPTVHPAFLPVILTGQFMANVDTAIANVAMPAIGATLHASGAELQLTVSGYVLASAALLVTAARLGANVGRRRLFLIGMAVFTLASLLCGLAPTAGLLIAARFLQGLGGALMVAQVITSIQLVFDGEARTRAVGALTVALSLSAVVGQILGGVLVSANLFGSSWRPIFLINVPIGIVLFVLALRVLPADVAPTVRPRLDVAGALMFAGAMTLLVLSLTLGREFAWPAWAWSALGLAVVLLATFVRWERSPRNAAPIVRPGLFASQRVVLGIVAITCSRLTYFSLLFVIALYLQLGLGESALAAGLSVVAWVGAYGLAGPLLPRLPKRFASNGMWVGCLLMAVAFAAMAIAVTHGAGGGPALIALLGFGGFAWGITSTTQTGFLTATVDRAYAPDLSGVLSTLAPLLTVIGIATYGSAYLALTHDATGGNAANAFAIICAAFAATNLVGTLAAASSARA